MDLHFWIQVIILFAGDPTGCHLVSVKWKWSQNFLANLSFCHWKLEPWLLSSWWYLMLLLLQEF